MRQLSTYFTFMAALASVVIVAAVGNLGGALSKPGAVPPNPSVDLIAYVDLDGAIRTVQPDGTPAHDVSPAGGFFTWPTWSPDGRGIAFSGAPQSGVGSGRLNLYVWRAGGGAPDLMYTNEAGMGPILPGMPHYNMWSPDGSLLSFMASVPQGLTLFLKDVASEEAPRVVLRDSPLYAAWSADSSYMLVHAGAAVLLVDVETTNYVADPGSRAGGYRAPEWSPSEDLAALAVEDGRGVPSVYTVNPHSGEQTLIDATAGEAAFLWSPDGSRLAVGRSESGFSPSLGGFIYESVTLHSPEGTMHAEAIHDNVIAFFWSPDGRKLAYVVLTESRDALRWMVMEVDGGDRRALVEFVPTRDQMTVFQFFDQFAKSNSPWSPDSRSLVFSGSLQGGVSASTGRQPASQVFVVSTDAAPAVEAVAGGILAFWSPR